MGIKRRCALTVAALTTFLAPAAASACTHAHGPFHAHGTQVLQHNGKPFTPYGITVDGLSYRRAAITAARRAVDDSYIRAAARAWCANTIRLQLGQDAVNLDGPAYLRAVEHEVRLAEHLGLVVILDDDTESETGNEPMPTVASSRFWKRIARMYGHDPQIIFDLFNEPRSVIGPIWPAWQDAMQQLDTTARQAGARNLIWVEGPMDASTLGRVPRYPIRDPDIAYAIHHPGGPHTVTRWRADFGFLIERHLYPVVEGEWTNWASTKNECWDDAPTAAVAFLRYLQAHRIGMIAWGLQPGKLVGNNPAQPTTFGANWSCTDGLGQSAGALIMRWFKQQNR